MRVIDSHTAGEPTRTIIQGGPDLGTGSMLQRKQKFAQQFDAIRTAVTLEPRGSDILVCALLQEPVDPTCAAGVIFFNNVGYLGMCGHGTIGVAQTLFHLGRISIGTHRLETPVGEVSFEYQADGRVTVQNVPSFRTAQKVMVEVPEYGLVCGDVAWGGNWFFLIDQHPFRLELAEADSLIRFTQSVKRALIANHITGDNQQEIDHIELFGPAHDARNQGRNFVLCPGNAYDRSPCGTGTSAKVACLMADGKLEPNQVWRQESIIGSVFAATGILAEVPSRDAGIVVIPRITGNAYVTADAQLLFHEDDPFQYGIYSAGIPKPNA
ncbi:MAG: proline racemase family protein [Planctomycetales bacterium]|nr:proline racemase family protein [Planctomycetales bacterium]